MEEEREKREGEANNWDHEKRNKKKVARSIMSLYNSILFENYK